MNIKKLLVSGATGLLLLGMTSIPAFAQGGFDQYGYNNTARVFQGPFLGWCLEHGITDQTLCGSYGFGSVNDQLVMKWNAEWDRGNAENWANPPYNAWTDNEWNGKVPGGSGVVWHYKIVWVGDYTSNPALIPLGAYGIWGQFAVVMDQGTDKTGNSYCTSTDGSTYNPTLNNGGHGFCALGSPSGYGAYFAH